MLVRNDMSGEHGTLKRRQQITLQSWVWVFCSGSKLEGTPAIRSPMTPCLSLAPQAHWTRLMSAIHSAIAGRLTGIANDQIPRLGS
jgi:hypothetical protein